MEAIRKTAARRALQSFVFHLSGRLFPADDIGVFGVIFLVVDQADAADLVVIALAAFRCSEAGIAFLICTLCGIDQLILAVLFGCAVNQIVIDLVAICFAPCQPDLILLETFAAGVQLRLLHTIDQFAVILDRSFWLLGEADGNLAPAVDVL